MLTFFQVVGALLFLFIAFTYCIVGFGGALIGAIACMFLPYDLNTCMAWGFCIGMVIQTLYNWRLMLRVIVSGLVGLLIAVLATWILNKFGVDKEVCQVVTMYCLIISIFAGSSWMREEFEDFLDHIGRNRSSAPTISTNDININVTTTENDFYCCRKCVHCSCHYCEVHGYEVADNHTCSDFKYN